MANFSTRPAIVVIVAVGLTAFLPTLASQAQTANKIATSNNKIGKNIYRTQCASCHGDKGQGNDEYYRQPLSGDLAVKQLSELISDTMPEEDPDKCVGKDALAVAQYIHNEFYSQSAQQRLNKARIELSHLTVRQYRQSVADVVGSFGPPLWISDKRGINARYFAASRWKKDRMLSEQVDALINFPESVPHFRADRDYPRIEEAESKKKRAKKNEMGDGFSVFWSGSLLAPETGSYQITVKCKNGFSLWINDLDNALIDRWVRSDDKLEHHATINLLAGRLYSLRLNMFTFKDPQATMQLEWKPPHGIKTAIPPSAFIEYETKEVAVNSTSFPPDDASTGYKRGVSVSAGWDHSTTQAALETATWVSSRIWKLAGTKETATNRAEKVQKFCHQFVQRAFVAELSGAEKQFFVDQHFSAKLSLIDSVKRVVMLSLKSPRFLYPRLQERTSDFELARRMALYFWDSVPDKQLFKVANQGKLDDPAIRNGQTYRMLNDPRSKQKLRDFFQHWLEIAEASEATKDEERFPDFNPALVTDLRTSMDLLLDDIIWKQDADFRKLFLTEHQFVNSRLADYYSFDSPSHANDDDFVKIKIESAQSNGILTHPLLMSGLAYHQNSSPIHRGVFVTRNLLGRMLKQPASAVAPVTEEFNPEFTTRQRVAHQTKATACMACHQVINPLGFSLENFDADGRFRTQEKQRTIESHAVYKTARGETIKLNGAGDLANYLADSKEAQQNFIRQLFQHYTNQSIQAFGDTLLDDLHRQFVAQNFNIKTLLVDISKIVIEHDRE